MKDLSCSSEVFGPLIEPAGNGRRRWAAVLPVGSNERFEIEYQAATQITGLPFESLPGLAWTDALSQLQARLKEGMVYDTRPYPSALTDAFRSLVKPPLSPTEPRAGLYWTLEPTWGIENDVVLGIDLISATGEFPVAVTRRATGDLVIHTGEPVWLTLPEEGPAHRIGCSIHIIPQLLLLWLSQRWRGTGVLELTDADGRPLGDGREFLARSPWKLAEAAGVLLGLRDVAPRPPAPRPGIDFRGMDSPAWFF